VTTIYINSDPDPPGEFYQPCTQHVDHNAIWSNTDVDSSAADLPYEEAARKYYEDAQ
jgi:hypothetical protein